MPMVWPLKSAGLLMPSFFSVVKAKPDFWKICAISTTGRPFTEAVSRSVIQVVPKSAAPATTVWIGDCWPMGSRFTSRPSAS